ncbi:hypothetical protein [Cohaesibacter sp. ES.047]|uniref:hypothetical protein n=1 Tax=Cohaesibacter sp. ES.047 TaxID=1798205 RepID=UPI000BB75335|nr:hypothetical protein [Cohaesibacter sp. ES.047]
MADTTTSSLITELEKRGGGTTQQDVEEALRELVATMVAMAEGAASPNFFLSSLDPGVGKTTAMVHFIRELVRSEQHSGASALLCFSRHEEIVRVAKELKLHPADYAVFTSEEGVNRLSCTPPNEARVLLTTHAMVKSRCRDNSFSDADVFHYQGKARVVRVWDEAMVFSEVISVNTDQLASLRDPLRPSHPVLAEFVTGLEMELVSIGASGIFTWPDVENVTKVCRWSAKRGLGPKQASLLDTIYALSGRHVLLRPPRKGSSVISALNNRDAIPDDLAPIVILDASGRVRSSYDLLGKSKGNLVKLPSVARNYRNLTIGIMHKGSGKDAWLKNGDTLAQEVAQLIDSKPDEEWLVIYLKGAIGGRTPERIKELLISDAGRVQFLNWGKHQGTNDFRHIQNVILASLNNYPETDYEMTARHCSGTPNDQAIAATVVSQVQAGEHMHHILQALCRSYVRQGSGNECGVCNAYIIAPPCSGARAFLPKVFPGCQITTWKPAKVKLKGWVADAIRQIEAYFAENPDGTYLYKDLRKQLGVKDISNFNKRVRKHDSFKIALDDLGLEEVTQGNGRYSNALAKKKSAFEPIAGSTCIADVPG